MWHHTVEDTGKDPPRVQQAGTTSIQLTGQDPPCVQQAGTPSPTSSIVLMLRTEEISENPADLSVFIGLNVSAGHALIDTAAQHGVIGNRSYIELCEQLSRHGFKPRILPTFQANAMGVGGSTTSTLTAEVPIAVQGVSGAVITNVVDTEMPFLLPMSFCKKPGMILDTIENTATWKFINKVSPVHELPSGHIAIDVMEFPKEGWTNPHEQDVSSILYTRIPKQIPILLTLS